jgi:peptidoglycan-N-acetylglucosamine deacetylase
MPEIQSTLLYVFSFIAMYAQVFLLLAFFQKKKEIKETSVKTLHADFPGVTILVPCWNEGKTIEKTMESLFALDYPKDKLFIKVINDGSTDDTWEKMQQYKDVPNVELYTKENGGKHTAMNMGIEMTTTEFVGCLDADAFVEPDALKKIMSHFADPLAMSVVPSVLVHDPKSIFQKAQKAEYDMGVFVKKILGLMDGIHVTPGPFSIYRKKVFTDLGMYKKAHSTEDMEIAYRMQVNGYRILHCHDAYVHTVTPRTFTTLYKQRLRWMYGFINNTIDYRKYLLRPKYGTFALFTVPTGAVTLVAPLILVTLMLIQLGTSIYNFFTKMEATNYFVSSPSLGEMSWFFVNTQPITIIMIILNAMVIGIILYGKKMRKEKPVPTLSLVYFIVIYGIMSPLWLGKAVYNTIASRDTAWR